MSFCKSIWNYIKLRFVSSTVLDNPMSAPTAPATVQENPRDKETVKRVAKAFKEQNQQMNMRALKPHDPMCKDVIMCSKQSCFKPEPDKIVSDEYKVQNKRRVRLAKRSCTKKITD